MCLFGYQNARFDLFGRSGGCNLPCGTELVKNGAVCGGINSLSVYQLEVIILKLSSLQTQPAHAYAAPHHSYVGCTQDLISTPVFQSNVYLAPRISGYEVFAKCQNIAVANNADYFGLKNGTTCVFGLSIAGNYSINGPSNSCNSACGSDSIWSGMHCGGLTSLSIFKLGVSFSNLSLLFQSSALIVTGTNFSSPLSSYNQYVYQGCYAISSSTSNIFQMTLNSSINSIDTCYTYAKNYLSSSATFFGLTNGTTCAFGYDNGLSSGLLVSGGLLPDSQCYQDCNSSSNYTSLSFYNSSNLPKCGSQSTISIYQLSNSAKSLSFQTNGTIALGNILLF